MSTSDQERDEQVDALLQSAREKRDDLQQAEAEIQQALGLNPGAAHVWFERGELYSAHEMLDKALACYEQARTMSQDNGDYEEAYTQAKAQLENQRTKLSELNLPKVIVAKGTDGLLPREDLETRILEEEDMPTDVIRVAPKVDDADESAPKERYAEGETVILEEAETGELETEPAGQPPEPTRAAPGDPDDPDDRLVTRALWKGAEALGKGAEALGKGINNVFGQPAQEPASDGEPEVKTKVISREALNEKLSDMLGSVDRQMLETLRETPGEIKDKLSRILATVDQDVHATETARGSVAEEWSKDIQIVSEVSEFPRIVFRRRRGVKEAVKQRIAVGVFENEGIGDWAEDGDGARVPLPLERGHGDELGAAEHAVVPKRLGHLFDRVVDDVCDEVQDRPELRAAHVGAEVSEIVIVVKVGREGEQVSLYRAQAQRLTHSPNVLVYDVATRVLSRLELCQPTANQLDELLTPRLDRTSVVVAGGQAKPVQESPRIELLVLVCARVEHHSREPHGHATRHDIDGQEVTR